MNKNEFLMRLRKALASLPFEECQSAMKYYEEYFAEAGEDREGEILKELGSPEMLAATILGEYPSAPARISDVRTSAASAGYAGVGHSYGSASGYGENREQPQAPWYRRTPLWVLVLLGICLAPIVLPIIGAVIAVMAAIILIIVSIIAVMAAFGIAGVGFGIGGIVMLLAGIARLVSISPAVGILTMGSGMLLVAIGILLVLATIWLISNIAPSIIRIFTELLRRIFNRGGTSR